MRVDYSEGDSHVLWEDGERVFRRGWRPGDDGNRTAVLIVRPAAEHPSRSSLDRLVHEYELKDELDGAWAVRPLDLVRDADRTMLVLEDAGGNPLEALLGTPMEVGHFLRLAVGMASALGKLHQHGLVHKDIKPAHILVHCADGQVRLTGFGLTSRLPRCDRFRSEPEGRRSFRARSDRAQACGTKSPRERAALSRGTDGTGTRESCRNHGAA